MDRLQGTGFSARLSGVRDAAQIMGATCKLVSETAQGCAFSIGPFEKVPTETFKSESAIAPEAAGLVTVLDNAPEVLQAMKSLLSGWGYEVRTALQPSDLGVLSNREILILDNDLGNGLYGIDLLEDGQFSGADAPRVVMISGTVSPELEARARGVGIPLLSKPLAPAQLRSALLAAAQVPVGNRSGSRAT